MRDERGRYTESKPLLDLVPEWARGCGHCNAGIASAPELTGAAPLYMERMVQHLDKSLSFCECRAGKAYYAALGNRYRQLIEEARKDKRLATFAARTSHPDIESARLAVHAMYEIAKPPTIHYEATAEAESEPVHA